MCADVFMFSSANSSSASCPTPCKEQTPCLLGETQDGFDLAPENRLRFSKTSSQNRDVTDSLISNSRGRRFDSV